MYGDTDNNINVNANTNTNINTNSNNNILIYSIVQIHPDTVPSVLHFRLKYRCVKERELVPWGRSSVWLQRGKAKMIKKLLSFFILLTVLFLFLFFSLVHCRPCARPGYRTFSFISHPEHTQTQWQHRQWSSRTSLLFSYIVTHIKQNTDKCKKCPSSLSVFSYLSFCQKRQMVLSRRIYILPKKDKWC